MYCKASAPHVLNSLSSGYLQEDGEISISSNLSKESVQKGGPNPREQRFPELNRGYLYCSLLRSKESVEGENPPSPQQAEGAECE